MKSEKSKTGEIKYYRAAINFKERRYAQHFLDYAMQLNLKDLLVTRVNSHTGYYLCVIYPCESKEIIRSTSSLIEGLIDKVKPAYRYTYNPSYAHDSEFPNMDDFVKDMYEQMRSRSWHNPADI